jgi:hypothetical protein
MKNILRRTGTKGPVIRVRLGDLMSDGRVQADMMIMIDVIAIGTGLGIEIERGIEIETGREDMIVGEMTETATEIETEIETGIEIGIDVDMTNRPPDVALLHLIDIENHLFQLVTSIQTRLGDHLPQAQRPKRRSRG